MTISETVSKNIPKRKRGRPRVIGDSMRHIVEYVAGDNRTERTKQNIFYRQYAIEVIAKDPRFAWIADSKKMSTGEPGAWKPGILSELGRIQDEDTVRAVAERICELRPKTKEAVAMIRRFRLGHEARGDYLTLVSHFERAANEYLTMRPSTSRDEIVRALRDLADCIDEEESTP